MKIYREITPLLPKDVFGIFSYPDASFDYPLHSHPEYEINLVTNGAGNRIIGDKIAKYEGTDLVLLGPNLKHSWDNTDKTHKNTTPTAVTFIQFDQHLLDSMTNKELFHPINTMLHYASRGIEFQETTKLAAIDKMKAIREVDGFESYLRFLDFLNFLAHATDKRLIASPGYSTKISTRENKRLDEVYQFMLDNFHKAISLKEVAAIANMSETSFSHFFKKSTNRSFIRFLTDIRLGHANRLLIKTQLSISEIAYKCGYTNLSNFNRLFKKYNSVTPNQYRNKLNYSTDTFEGRFTTK